MIKSVIRIALCYFLIFGQAIVHAQSTAAILPQGKTQFFDNNGDPLTSGKVFFYIPSTTTFKTTWQNSAKSIANANPVILDAGGRAIIYGDGTYRQIVKDRNNNTVYDAVTASAGTGRGTTGTGDGDLVGTVKPWAGLVAPNQYVFAYGQEISRTTYSVLFTAITLAQNITCTSSSPILTNLSDTSQIPIGSVIETTCVAAGSTVSSKTSTTVTLNNNASLTTSTTARFFLYGNGDGSTTFNLPDYRGFVLAGRTNMGGVTSTNLTSTYFGTFPNATGARGGFEAHFLLPAELPPYTPVGSISQITPAGAISTATGSISQITPAGTINTPTISNVFSSTGSNSYTPAGTNSTSSVTGNATVPTFPTGTGGGATTFFTPTVTGTTSTVNLAGGTAAAQTFTGTGITLSSTSSALTFTGTPVTPTFTGASQIFTGTPVTPTFTGTAQGGLNTPISIIQPTQTTNYIIKITPDSNSTDASGVTSLGGMIGDIACGNGLLCTGNIISSSFTFPLDSTNITYTSPLTGGVLRTGSSKFQDEINAKDFGVICDGVTDDQANIQKAINAAASSPSLTKIVKLPKGTCAIGSTIFLAQGVSLKGQGGSLNWASFGITIPVIYPTRLLWTGSTSTGVIIDQNDTVIADAGLSDLVIDGQTPSGSLTTSTLQAIKVRSSFGSKFERLGIQNVGVGFSFEPGFANSGVSTNLISQLFIQTIQMVLVNIGMDFSPNATLPLSNGGTTNNRFVDIFIYQYYTNAFRYYAQSDNNKITGGYVTSTIIGSTAIAYNLIDPTNSGGVYSNDFINFEIECSSTGSGAGIKSILANNSNGFGSIFQGSIFNCIDGPTIQNNANLIIQDTNDTNVIQSYKSINDNTGINLQNVNNSGSATSKIRFGNSADSTLGFLTLNGAVNSNLSGANSLNLGVSANVPLAFWQNGVERARFTTNGLTIGKTGTTTGRVDFAGATSGAAIVTAQAAAGTPTLTLPNASGTFAISASSPIVLNATTGNLTCPTCATTGGASIPTIAQGDLLYGSAVNALSALAKDTNSTRYLSNTGTTNNPAWAQVNLANGVTSTLPFTNGGFGITTATSGGIPYFSSTTTVASSGLLAANQIVLGGGAATTPSTLGSLGTTTTVLHGNAAGAPTFGAVISADLNITTTSCSNQFITAISAGGVGTCTTDTLASSQHANQGTTSTVLHGNASGNPSWGAVALSELTTQATNTIVGNATSGTAVPTALAIGTCSTSSSALIWTTNTGFGCNTSINATTVTTNANLTGVITSVGNATSIASQTGTGTKFVVDNTPTLITPILGVATATSINKVAITAPATSATLTIADGKTATHNTSTTFAGTDGKTLTISNSGTLSGGDAFVLSIAAAKTFTVSNTLTLTATDGSTLAIGTGGTLGTAAYKNYSEGTWTPAFIGQTTPGTGQTYSSQAGFYEVVGRQVTARFYLVATSLGTAAGNLLVSGLPFSSSATANSFGTCDISLYTVTGLAALSYGLTGYVFVGSGSFTLNQNNSTGVAQLTVTQAGANASIMGTCKYMT